MKSRIVAAVCAVVVIAVLLACGGARKPLGGPSLGASGVNGSAFDPNDGANTLLWLTSSLRRIDKSKE
jgi:hypothetical protein